MKLAHVKFRQWSDVVGTVRAAALLGQSAGYVSNIRSGKRSPGPATAARIEELTHGAITAAEWADPVTPPPQAA